MWVNDNLINPPAWKYAGRKGNLEAPLIDEGYEYRQPARILLKQGWNKILVKLPVAGFEGNGSNNPVKWMFTFVPL